MMLPSQRYGVTLSGSYHSLLWSKGCATFTHYFLFFWTCHLRRNDLHFLPYLLTLAYNQVMRRRTQSMVKSMLLLLVQLVISGIAHTQGMKIGEVLIMSHPNLNSNTKPEAFQAFVTKEMLPVLNKQGQGTTYHLFKADRGKQKGQFLLAGTAEKINDPRGTFVKSPFNAILLEWR